MNPWVPVIAAIGVVMIIAGYKNSQGNLLAAITGKPQASGQNADANGFITPTAMPTNQNATPNLGGGHIYT